MTSEQEAFIKALGKQDAAVAGIARAWMQYFGLSIEQVRAKLQALAGVVVA